MKGDEYLKEILRFYLFKLDAGGCGMQEVDSLTKLLEQNMQLSGTKEEFARFYGKSKDAVSSVINRKMSVKPKRNKVLYPFHLFAKLVPPSWHETI